MQFCFRSLHTPNFMHRKPKRSRRRCQYYPNAISARQILLLGGDISTNPGPDKSGKTSKPKCYQCERTIAKNHRFVQCDSCNCRSHLNCARISMKVYRLGLRGWICAKCVLGIMPDPENLLSVDMEFDEQIDCNETNLSTELSGLDKARAKLPREFLLAHLNINSIQNKFDEIAEITRKSRAQIMIISETKIDSTYPDSQFMIPGYSLLRNNRKKGGGGILAYISSDVTSKRMKLQRSYKTFEPIVFEVELKVRSIVVIGIYRSPSIAFTISYQQQLKEELNHICTWASLHKRDLVLLGDLNLDRLRLDKAEEKLLRDLEET